MSPRSWLRWRLIGLFSGVTLIVPGGVSAQDAAVASSPPPAGLVEESLRTAAADRWGVERERIRVVLPEEEARAPQPADSVEVRGGDSERWLVTTWREGVPRARYVRVGVERVVPMAARDLSRGEVVSEEDIRRTAMVRVGPPDDDRSDPVGWITERRIRAGEPLEVPGVRPPFLVRGGEAVEAVLVRAGLLLSVRGEALASARAGERLHVRLETGRRVEARAVSPGRVRLEIGGPR